MLSDDLSLDSDLLLQCDLLLQGNILLDERLTAATVHHSALEKQGGHLENTTAAPTHTASTGDRTAASTAHATAARATGVGSSALMAALAPGRLRSEEQAQHRDGNNGKPAALHRMVPLCRARWKGASASLQLERAGKENVGEIHAHDLLIMYFSKSTQRFE